MILISRNCLLRPQMRTKGALLLSQMLSAGTRGHGVLSGALALPRAVRSAEPTSLPLQPRDTEAAERGPPGQSLSGNLGVCRKKHSLPKGICCKIFWLSRCLPMWLGCLEYFPPCQRLECGFIEPPGALGQGEGGEGGEGESKPWRQGGESRGRPAIWLGSGELSHAQADICI